jgi:flagellar biosynthesis protein FlhF
MQVKKFEARTMKEALEMVKKSLGPDAIILAAKDNQRSFGLVGEGSVEITAAISEETLRKKQFAESRLPAQQQQRLQSSPAKAQKQVIEKMVNKYLEDRNPQPAKNRRYIDIEDEMPPPSTQGNSAAILKRSSTAAVGSYRSAGNSKSATGMVSSEIESQPATQKNIVNSTATNTVVKDQEILSLKKEVESLKKLIAQFQEIPQNFVTTPAAAFVATPQRSYPGAEYGLNYEVVSHYEKLLKSGVDPEIASQMLLEAQQTLSPGKLKSKPLVEAWLARKILDTTLVSAGHGSEKKVHVFVGPSGSGKTSMLVKMASHWLIKDHKRIAMITTDTQKVGAADQLKIYSQILNVPFGIVRTPMDWPTLVNQLENIDHILVDSPGLSYRDASDLHWAPNLFTAGSRERGYSFGFKLSVQRF